MNKIVYTAIFGNYEELKQPTVITPGWKYICFTDQDISSPVWEIVKMEPHLESRRMARYIKIMFHKFVDAEFSLWLDASFQIKMDLNVFWDKVFKTPFTCPAHPIRNCVYMEIKSCLVNQRGEADLLLQQEAKYRALNVPAFNGIITSGVLLRERTAANIKLCEQWWKELEENSTRDQIAFARISIGYEFHTFNWDYSQSKDLKFHRHYHQRH